VARLKLGVLVSGRGSNLQAILDAVSEGRLDADVGLVISNRADAQALARAELSGVPARVISHRDFDDRSAFDRALVAALTEAKVSVVVLAGFMRVLTSTFLDAFPWAVINVHPAILPAFPGVDSQKQALDWGVKIAGCTVHFVDKGTDTGPIIAQGAVPVLDEDTEDDLKLRILELEHRVLVEVLRWMAEGRVQVVAGNGRPRVVTRGVCSAVFAAGSNVAR
jgi:phosphoribosylglycinamide formyltransferase 1